MTALRKLAGVLSLALLQFACAGAAAWLFDHAHPAAAILFALATPLAVGWGGARLRLGLALTMLSYAILPFAAAAYFRGIPALVLKRGGVLVLWAFPPTAAAWWLSRRLRGED